MLQEIERLEILEPELERFDFVVYDEDEQREKEIDAAAYVEWLGVLAGMWDAIGKSLDERRLEKYAKELSYIPLGLLEKSVSRAMRNNGEYQVVPTIGAIHQALKNELGNPRDVDEAIDQWKNRLWARCFCDFGGNRR